MRRKFEAASLGRLLAKLELTLLEAGPRMQELAGAQGEQRTLTCPEDWDEFWTGLREPPILDLVQARIRERSGAATTYFRQMGLFDSVPWAVVDLGWHLTCQRSLQCLLGHEEPGRMVQGLYLGLASNRCLPQEAGKTAALFYRAPDEGLECLAPPELFQRITLLEHLVGCAPHGTVHHYALGGDRAEPVGGAVSRDQIEFSARVCGLAIQFVRDHALLAEEFNTSAAAQGAVAGLLESFFRHPRPELVQQLQSITFSEDQNNFHPRPLATAFGLREALGTMFPGPLSWLAPRRRPDRLWLEGSLALSGRLVQTLSRLRPLWWRYGQRHLEGSR